VDSKQKRSNFLVKQDEEQHFFHGKTFITTFVTMTAKMKGKFKLISSPTLGKKGVSNHIYYQCFFLGLSSVDLTLNSPILMRTAVQPQSSSFCGYFSYVVLNLKLKPKNFGIWKK
jgi:hypothetical protein